MQYPIFALIVVVSACARPHREAPADPLASVSADDLYRRGHLARAAGDAERAEQYFAAALDRGLPVAVGLPALLDACVDADRYDSALHHVLVQLDRDPEDWSLRLVAASLAVALGDEATARTQLARILAQVPDQPEALDLVRSLP